MQIKQDNACKALSTVPGIGVELKKLYLELVVRSEEEDEKEEAEERKLDIGRDWRGRSR